jgi:hypothetical protein
MINSAVRSGFGEHLWSDSFTMPTSGQTYIKTPDFKQADNNQGYCPQKEEPVSQKTAKGLGLS